MSKVRCFLMCKGASHLDIPLLQVVVVVFGRGKITKIKEARLVGCVGSTGAVGYRSGVSDCEGKVVGLGKMVAALHKTQVEILSGQFEHQVLFNSPPSEKESQGVKEVVEESH